MKYICPYCSDTMYSSIHNTYNCSRSDHLCSHSVQEFYLIVLGKYKIGMHFNGPTYYFSDNTSNFRVEIIPAFEFHDMNNVLQRILKIKAFL